MRALIIGGGIEAKLVVYPIGAGRSDGTRLTNWAVCIRTGTPGDPPPHRQDWSRPATVGAIAEHLKRFRTSFVDHDGLARATGQFFEFPMCDRDPLPSWSHGRVTLLGDAAHVAVRSVIRSPRYPRATVVTNEYTESSCGASGPAAANGDARPRCTDSHAAQS